jgi:hypothetical protein
LWDIDFIYSDPHPALFGYGPQNTHWQMAHGGGGGHYSLNSLWPGLEKLWESASRE